MTVLLKHNLQQKIFSNKTCEQQLAFIFLFIVAHAQKKKKLRNR